MRILGIETSCDETAAAVVEDGRRVLSNAVATASSASANLAGVIPEEAARRQVECMLPVLERALAEAGASPADIDAIAVTRGPGLLGSLLVGTMTARALAFLWRKPLIGIHHTFGHLSSTWLLPQHVPHLPHLPDVPQFPVLTLSASGGHTDLWYRTAHTRGLLLGRTRDDAAGEAFDKGASLLGLPFPGGPAIARAAEGGDPRAFSFPLPLKNDPTLDFSFSGLKTSLKYLLRDLESGQQRDIAASFQHAICAHLADRAERALRKHPDARELHLVGGVSANTELRKLLEPLCRGASVVLRTPAANAFCTDNAAMIAAAGFFLLRERGEEALTPFDTEAPLPLRAVVRG